ncbi:MAG: isoprenoid biosynthesis glyoxalase ElbB [Elusimicrobia bacterium]|nr:isoprenoid biosynthesis glyoxalase ElbB [Elusimicrobiota bacterium]
MPKIGVILSGCGVKDGSEIHEATLLLLAIDKAGAQAACFAPNKEQAEVVDHVSGRTVRERRNVLVESARLARGEIRDLSEAKVSELDAVILPGGFGAAKNLSSFAEEGAQCQVDPEVARVLRGMRQAGKPIGAACIAPVVLARLFAGDKPLVTIGSDQATARAIESMGARHENAPVTGVVVDPQLRLATTPCYMLATRISQVAEGMDALVKAVLEMAAATAKK